MLVRRKVRTNMVEEALRVEGMAARENVELSATHRWMQARAKSRASKARADEGGVRGKTPKAAHDHDFRYPRPLFL